jgi:hypothetical protein
MHCYQLLHEFRVRNCPVVCLTEGNVSDLLSSQITYLLPAHRETDNAKDMLNPKHFRQDGVLGSTGRGKSG